MSAPRKYVVHSAFLTLQGEGFHTGRRAVFVRLAGCNVWSGREEDRARDTEKGCCARWCDTEFRGGEWLSAFELVERVVNLWGLSPDKRVVITGGEPALQIDAALVDALRAASVAVHVETNGSILLPWGISWVTLSPKPPMLVLVQHYDEVKVVFPAVDPAPYARAARNLFVQPLSGKTTEETREHSAAAVAYVLANPMWRLSTQTHKTLDIP